MHNIQHPTTFDPSTLWSYEQAQMIWLDMETYADSNIPTSLAIESLLHAHAPTSRSWDGQEPYAACNGDCWGDGHRDIPKPWPCPAIMPILHPLAVEKRPVI